MTVLREKDMHTPFTGADQGVKMTRKIMGHILKGRNEQQTAASLATSPVARMTIMPQGGTIHALYFMAAAACGSGESMTIDVLKNGTSILSGGTAYTYDATKTNKVQLDLGIDPTKTKFAAGDVFVVTRVYTAGTATPMGANAVWIEYASSNND